jgi:O-antigen/teichoic acid export membrane protein
VSALQVLAANFLLTYVATLCCMYLTSVGRAWTVTLISFAGLLANPVLNALLIRQFAERGPGGGGTGAALATVSTELLVTFVLLYIMGKHAFDRRSLNVLVRTTLVCVGVVVLHVQLGPLLGVAPWLLELRPQTMAPSLIRLALDLLAYGVLALVLRAVHWREMLDFARSAFRSRRGNAA